MSHTPGPWIVHNFVEEGTIRAGMYEIEEAHYVIKDFLMDGDHERAEAEAAANTLLIQAAPEMLSALKAIVHAVRVDNSPGKQRTAWDLVDSAIAKAEKVNT